MSSPWLKTEMRLQRLFLRPDVQEEDVAEVKLWLDAAKSKDPDALGADTLLASAREYLLPMS